MMYQHTVSGIGCSGNSPTSTPPNINACSSSTPPLANTNHQNNNTSHENNSDQLVRIARMFVISYTNAKVHSLIHEHAIHTYTYCIAFIKIDKCMGFL